ncbi:hypothetical protein WBP07_14635 [Novosphingobium sp. BL-8A]|uniref:hypothetical protein n=1 Tax=Novosphingobium sp. BL-8A TaxID=3127639 RepID=UPI003756BC33
MIGRTHLEFRADYAKSVSPETEPSGEEVIAFLVNGIRQSGIAAAEPFAEDWGWCSVLHVDGFRFLLGCGDYLEYEDGWLCFIDFRQGFRRFFKPNSARQALRHATHAMHGAVQGNPRCRDRKWWSDTTGVGAVEEC